VLVEDYNWHMDYVDIGDRMDNNYLENLDMDKKTTFSLPGPHNTEKLYDSASCGIKIDQRNFNWLLLKICW
jgi:hypothetical protein